MHPATPVFTSRRSAAIRVAAKVDSPEALDAALRPRPTGQSWPAHESASFSTPRYRRHRIMRPRDLSHQQLAAGLGSNKLDVPRRRSYPLSDRNPKYCKRA
jgi:hypothetical protein